MICQYFLSADDNFIQTVSNKIVLPLKNSFLFLGGWFQLKVISGKYVCPFAGIKVKSIEINF